MTELPIIDRVMACCAPLAREPLSAQAADELAGLLKALLTSRLALSQPTVSHHLKVLLDAGLVSRDKRGVWAYYRAMPGALGALAGLLAPVQAAA
jgi:ArsR family transcriptional regulator